MGKLGNAIEKETAWGTTWNGADTLMTTGTYCLDLFGRAGAMRSASVHDKQELFAEAYNENADMAMKLLFYIRDVRGGYGERDTFADMVRWVANNHADSIEKNLWAFLEYGRAKDLYALIGTKAEDAMWKFVKEQFELDKQNMAEGKSISLLAKWVATPDSKVKATRDLGMKTAKALGYNCRNVAEYKKILRAMRKYLDVPEVKMCAGKWDEIEYSKLGSQCLIKHKNAWKEHDSERYEKFIQKASTGEVKMNTGTMTPCDIIHTANNNYSSDLEVMWNNLEDNVKGNALVMCDTSGSMTSCYNSNSSVTPMEVAVAMSIYLGERNKGDLKDMFMTFSSRPKFVKIHGSTLQEKYMNIRRLSIVDNTNLEAGFELLLDTSLKNKVPVEDMPDAIVVISDMQIDPYEIRGIDENNRLTFYDEMKKRYESAGYKIPQVVFWNVNASNPTFHATHDTAGVSLVSGFSTNIYKQVMDSLGTTPYELMMQVVSSERYSKVVA